jgi:hypothetical protein
MTIEAQVEAPQKTAEPAPGWQRFETENLEISLPDSYVGGDPRRDKRGILERSREVGPDFHDLMKSIVGQLRKTDERVDGWFGALDSASEAQPGIPEVRVVRERVGFTGRRKSLHEYVERWLNPRGLARVYARGVSVLEQSSTVRLGRHESERFVIDVAGERKLMYVVKGRKEFCTLTYGAGLEHWDRLLPLFEKSASTLKMKEVEPA